MIKTARRSKSLNEMVEEICEWYGMDREELKTVGCFVMHYLEGDYIGALFTYKEWKEKYYNEGKTAGG